MKACKNVTLSGANVGFSACVVYPAQRRVIGQSDLTGVCFRGNLSMTAGCKVSIVAVRRCAADARQWRDCSWAKRCPAASDVGENVWMMTEEALSRDMLLEEFRCYRRRRTEAGKESMICVETPMSVEHFWHVSQIWQCACHRAEQDTQMKMLDEVRLYVNCPPSWESGRGNEHSSFSAREVTVT